MKKVLFLLFIAMSAGLAADWSSAEDNPVVEREVSLYSDVKAQRIGDVLSVIISESNSATNTARTNTNNQNKTNAKGEATTGALKGLFPGVGGSMDVSNQYNGQGNTLRNGQFTSRMTVKVVDIYPNGNLVIEGTKTMEINEETEVVTLSGVVQPTDISSSNTIYSYQIANAKFTYKGKGSISDGHRPGLLVRIINWLL
ncbi:MAG TPA: flagellar basal body L-ring protein FlgH [Anaerolineae bacterium]|nr:flagellar basal body L-ring protein FlgH [Anaerolineae bacterium]